IAPAMTLLLRCLAGIVERRFGLQLRFQYREVARCSTRIGVAPRTPVGLECPTPGIPTAIARLIAAPCCRVAALGIQNLYGTPINTRPVLDSLITVHITIALERSALILAISMQSRCARCIGGHATRSVAHAHHAEL